MNTKYEFTGETKEWCGVTLRRIRAVTAIAALGIASGDLGGWIENEGNLSVSGSAWVYGSARVFGSAQVFGEAQVSGEARVFGSARVYGVNVTSTRTDGYTFTVAPTQDGPRIMAGCRYFSFAEARRHWAETRAGTRLGEETFSILDHLERMSTICGFDAPIVEDAA